VRLATLASPVALTVLLTGSAGGTPTGSATAPAGGPGRFKGQVDIGDGRKLYQSCRGRGTPTVILEAGYHDSSALWSLDEPTPPAVGPSVQERLAERVRVCSYDRPGTIVYANPPTLTTRSTLVAQPRTAASAVRDLHALVGAAKLTTPIVIVAHSFGGLLARLYAQTYSKETAGVVFVDSFPPTIPKAMGADWPAYRELLTNPGTTFDTDPAFERFDIDASVAEVAGAPAFPAIPIAVLPGPNRSPSRRRTPSPRCSTGSAPSNSRTSWPCDPGRHTSSRPAATTTSRSRTRISSPTTPCW
jgi:pimeloyl-ACP methyl ester carboxylesterase